MFKGKKVIIFDMDGFSGDNPEDPYESLSDGYKIALEKSFNKNDSEYQIIHYLGKKDEESISTATVVYKKDKAIIYNVTTNKKYQRNGVCKQLMSDIIQDLRKLNINEVCVQTEQGFYTEQVYKNMGFIERLLGKAYIEKE
jgi:N-acetylglutamate synthase-like GNAT family acetyltransferase